MLEMIVLKWRLSAKKLGATLAKSFFSCCSRFIFQEGSRKKDRKARPVAMSSKNQI